MSDPFGTLRNLLRGEVDASVRRRAEYSSDASNYRVVPSAVVFPRDADDVAVTLEYARAQGISVTARGAGTSVAGNAIGPGLVLDFSRHLDRVRAIDPEGRTAHVEPGVVLADLQRAAAPHGLRFGPDPSTQSRCTLGGMIGNNACGPRAVAWGRTVDNVRRLRILDGTGTVHLLADELADLPGAAAFVSRHLALIRTELGTFDRQASGYSLEHLLPERGHSLAKAFVGTEGTCGLLLEAEVGLVDIPAATALVVLGYADLPTAAEDVAALLAAHPLAIEGIDAGLVDVVRAHRRAVPDLPRGSGWLFVETSGSSVAEAVSRASAIAGVADALGTRIVADPREASALWNIRADGAGLAGRTPQGEPAWPGWEDAAVPQAHLAAYLRDFAELTRAHGVTGLLYGHFGDGCIHVRLDLPIAQAPERFRDFLVDAAVLVASHGGSLSGEHGDGRARSELLPHMYSPAVLAAFAEFKGLFDPDGMLNPGVLVDPRRADDDLRLASVKAVPVRGFSLSQDGGDLSRALHRCVGVGKCRADGGAMCPSYLATRDEKDSTRGRARVLQEAVNGALLSWDSPAVEESLDLCLSCKACATDCPAGVDMATYKSETLHRRYRRRLRPVDHYVLGWLPRWLRAAKRAPRLSNSLVERTRRMWPLVGIDGRRDVPELASESFRRWWRRNRVDPADADVLLFVDTFTDAFAPHVAVAAVEVLEAAGRSVRIAPEPVCCGLTWITTGQLDGARRHLRRLVATLSPHVAAGGSIVGLEPSCTAVLRSDLTELLPDDVGAAAIAQATRTLAETLGESDWRAPDLTGVRLVVQPHCHHRAVLGIGPDTALLDRAGAQFATVTGCCGLAGNFGMQRGHYDVSTAIAEHALLPALRDDPEAMLVADGFSCRTQAWQLARREGKHLAELLRDSLVDGKIRPARARETDP